MLLHLLLACKPTWTFDTAPPAWAGCGNGTLEGLEECDAGLDNADIADACRTDCTLPACGDAILDADEACDDGGPWYGDGCTPACAVEAGLVEDEPNDRERGPQAWEGPVTGSLHPADEDCWTLEMPLDGWLSAELAHPDGGPCPTAQIDVYDPTGVRVAVGTPNEGAGCSTIDPAIERPVRFVDEGTWTVCVTPSLDQDAWGYVLTVESGDDSCELDIPLPQSEDLDGDGLLALCDDDDDGDGVLDVEDNCPEVPNGPDSVAPVTGADGWIQWWLTLAPLTGRSSSDNCRPPDEQVLGDDAAATPALGDQDDGQSWHVMYSDGARIDLKDHYGHAGAPREAYQVVYVYSETEQDVELTIGPDDGAYAWLNGELVLETSACQGTSADRYKADVTLNAGWNRLMTRVYDHGGGWGNYVRFRQSGVGMAGLQLSIDPSGAWPTDQTDSDGDGIGDICDLEP
jgi:cysteine-rich repeat protein